MISGPSTIQVRVRLFAAHRDSVGRANLVLDVAPGTTGEMLWEKIVADYPRLTTCRRIVRYAVNQQFCNLDAELQDGDEVTYIPPVVSSR